MRLALVWGPPAALWARNPDLACPASPSLDGPARGGVRVRSRSAPAARRARAAVRTRVSLVSHAAAARHAMRPLRARTLTRIYYVRD